MSTRQKLVIFVGTLVTLGIFAALFIVIDWQDLLSKFTPAMAKPLAAASGLYFIVLILRSVRLTILLSHLGETKLKLLRLFDLIAINNLANHILPLRLGEVILLGLLKTREGLALERATAGLFLTRVADLALLLVGLSGAFYWLNLSVTFALLCLGLGLIGLFFVIRVDVAIIVLQKCLTLFLRVFSSDKIKQKGEGIIAKLESLRSVVKSPFLIFINLLFGALVWGLNTLSFWCVVEGLGIHLNALQIYAGSAGAAILPSLPINALGTLGPLEAGWTAGFVAVGVEASAAASSGLVVHAMILAVSVLTALYAISRVGLSSVKAAMKRNDVPLDERA